MRVIDLGSIATTGVIGSFSYPGAIADNAKLSIASQLVVVGDPLTITVDMEGSLDNVNWFSIDTHVFTAGELTALGTLYHIVDKPVQYLRANVTTLTATTSATINASILVGR